LPEEAKTWNGFECNRDFSPTENYVKLKVMPTPSLNSTNGRDFFCSVCKTKLKSEWHRPTTNPTVVRRDYGPSVEWSKDEEDAMKDAKLAVLREWDEHLRTAHPRQWERERKKRANRAARERSNRKRTKPKANE
jgi:hypothetical protein